MHQYLVVGINAFGAAVIERARALPLEQNVVFHHLECPPERRVADRYVEYRQRLLDVLNREVHNFANTPLTVYLVGLIVERHLAEDLTHLGYLFKTFFRENIILSPRVKLLTALPTILPEEAYEWLPETRRALERIDHYASLAEPFQPAYEGVKRALPAISGPPFEEAAFCYSESLDAEDVAVTAQAAATKIYFDLVLLPARVSAEPGLGEYLRSFPSGQRFAPISGTAVSFFPSLAKMARDELEYLLLVRLVDRFLGGAPPEAKALEALADEVLRKAGLARPRDLVDGVVAHALEKERWFDLAAVDALAAYDAELSPPPPAHVERFLAGLERDRNRFAGRLRDLALEHAVTCADRLMGVLRADYPHLGLRELDAVFTQAFFRASQVLERRGTLAGEARAAWQKARQRAQETAKRLAEEAGKDLRRGSPAEARVKQALAELSARDILRACLAVTVAEALADDEALGDRARELYDTHHEALSAFLSRHREVMTHLSDRREAFLQRRELYLYVFNQVFRRELLDAELERRLTGMKDALEDAALRQALGAFFFKKWLPSPALPLAEVEEALLEAVRLSARAAVERVASEIQVDLSRVVRILGDIAKAQVSAIFDTKYKEHPQAAYGQALFLFHRDDALPASAADARRDGVDRAVVARVPDLPFQVLHVSEVYNLPFRALRQYASLDRAREEGAP